jgi:hypothetical protein
MILRGRSLQL